MEKKWYCKAMLIMLLAIGPFAYGDKVAIEGTEIQNIRIGLTPGRTRVVFDLNQSCLYTAKTLKNSKVVQLEIAEATNSVDLQSLPLQGTPITHIFSDTQSDASLRYMLELSHETNSQFFTLAPQAGRGHRLVLDLYDPESAIAAIPADDKAVPEDSVMQTATVDAVEQNYSTASKQSSPATNTPANRDTHGEWSGYIGLEPRLFFQSATYPEQDDQNISVTFQPEYFVDWANGRQRFAFSPFFRLDANDDERTHADIRELYWSQERDQLLVKIGLDVVFWGVAESRHLVDIINQTDLVENIDGEDKLGQPMFNLDYWNEWGTWQVYVLPYFRERTFAGEDGRLRVNPAVNTNDPEYESGSEEKHVDFALRWSHFIGDWDIGVAHFSGTSREPLLIPALSGQKTELIPFYPQIDQSSLDAQATIGAWLWKLEAIYNQNDFDDYYAYVGGFEYTQFGVAQSSWDLGWLLEYNYDQRGEAGELGESATSALQNDIFMGLRWSGNDIAGSELLAAITVDVDNGSTFGNIEASRRMGESWTLELEMRVFTNIDRNDLLYFIRNDDYLEIRFTRHF